MINIIQTVIICLTALAISWLVCRTLQKLLIAPPPPAPTERETDFQKQLDEEYEQQRKTALGVVKEIQSLFLDDDQIEEGK